MKTFNQTILMCALCAILPMTFCSCKKLLNKDIDEISTSSFNLDKFEQNIKDTYSAQVTGFSYAISVDGKVARFGASGNARILADGIEAYTPETRQELFSVTKFVTAIAICKVLDAKGKDLSEKVADHLPTYWKVHGSYDDLTFEQLLSHYSGFSIENRGYDSLKKMMGIPQIANAFNYNNANYALCRVLLPYLYYDKSYFKNAEEQDINETATAWAFRSLIRNLVLKPSQLQFYNIADFKDWNHQGVSDYPYARYYVNSNLSEPSVSNSDDILIAGSRGLTLSSYEMAEILTAFENNMLLSADWVSEMKSKKCGFDGSGINGEHGKYFWKNGSGTNAVGAGGETIIMIFPNKVRVSLNCNSNRTFDDSFVSNATNMAKAYDDAW